MTSERKHALRCKLAIDKYNKSKAYDLGTLVAFSGTLDDPEYGIHDEVFEVKMNPGVGPDLAEAFAEPNYRVMTAADKFQTGFDQPLLRAMQMVIVPGQALALARSGPRDGRPRPRRVGRARRHWSPSGLDEPCCARSRSSDSHRSRGLLGTYDRPHVKQRLADTFWRPTATSGE
ncbi:hypothetical protein [Streptomyces sp. NBC_01618]|uniref:hypothetical protein n=1 Tax=Streptomyces sp. NBC_01618 TaxID=2975900 RepID=UPI00386E109C|nr:hypothetical protein OH735_30425 [Streptomyces sp. NBC_01618]